jgi:hypothetical protein
MSKVIYTVKGIGFSSLSISKGDACLSKNASEIVSEVDCSRFYNLIETTRNSK